MTGNDTCALAVAIVLNRLMREIWSKRQIEGQFHHRMSTCAVPALPLCTNRQSIQLAANLPTSHRVRKTTGAIHNTGATSTPGGYVREKPKTIQQQVKSERSARGYSTVKYGQINSSQTVSSPFTKPTNTITVSQLSSPTTTTLKKHNILQFFFKTLHHRRVLQAPSGTSLAGSSELLLLIGPAVMHEGSTPHKGLRHSSTLRTQKWPTFKKSDQRGMGFKREKNRKPS